MSQVPNWIQTLKPYVAGKPIEETQRELGLRRVIKLASNENPLGPSPKALKAIQKSLKDLHRYPDGAAFRLKQVLAKHHKVSTAEILVGNGSNEIIELLIRTFCQAGDAIATGAYAFIAYSISAQAHGVTTLVAPAKPDLGFDLDALLKEIQAHPRVKIVFLPNPNNPTGTSLGATELRTFLRGIELLKRGILVCLDAAYQEYVDPKKVPDPEVLRKEFGFCITMRTFSKVYGLGGLRVGYALASPDILQWTDRIRLPFNVSSAGLAGAEAAVLDQAFVRKGIRLNETGRALWERFLLRQEVPFIKSQGNFFLLNVQDRFGMSGPEVFQASLEKGVIFRPVINYGLPGYLRVTIGTREENLLAQKVLKAMLPEVAQAKDKIKSVPARRLPVTTTSAPLTGASYPKLGPVIAIDGPAGTGKSSATRRLAERLGFIFVDTGALYRSVAFRALKQGWLVGAADEKLTKDQESRITHMAEKMQLEFKRLADKVPMNRIFCDGEDITDQIRTLEVGMGASRVSAIPGVRAALLGLQRKLGAVGRSILEGRDIGTVIFPDADVKFFVKASVDERAKRRLIELEATGGETPSFEEVKRQIQLRDQADTSRAVAPLRAAADAIELDTTHLTLDEVVREMERVAYTKLSSVLKVRPT